MRANTDTPQPENLNTALLAASPDAVIVLDVRGRVVEFNLMAEQIFGYRRADAIGRSLGDLIVPARMRAASDDMLGRCLASDRDFSRKRVELTAMRADGSELPIELIVSAGRYPMPLFIGYIRDLTEARRAEAARQRSEQRLAEAQRVAQLGSWEYDARTQEIAWSDETFRIFGLEPDQNAPSYTSYLQRLHPDDAPLFEAAVVAAIEDGSSYEFDQRILRPDGELRHIHTMGQPLYDDQGLVVKLVGIMLDVTPRKRAEEALQEQDARMRVLVEQMPAIVWTVDPELRFTSSTGTGLIALGLRPDEVVGMSLWEFWQTDDPAHQQIVMHRRALNGEIASYEAIYLDRVYHTHVEPLKNASGQTTGVIGVALDITESRRAEAALHESEERFRNLIENGSDVITVLGADGIIHYESPSVERVMGYRPEELLGKSAFEFVHPEDLALVLESIRAGLEHPDDQSPIQFRFRHRDGSYRMLEAMGRNLLDKPGIDGFVVNSRDVTERQRAQEHIQRQFERLTALRAIDNLINASFDLHVTLSNFVDQVTALLHVDAAIVAVCDLHTCTLEFTVAKGLHNRMPRCWRIKLDQGLVGKAALETRLQQCDDVRVSPQTFDGAEFLAEEGFVSCLAVPLLAKRQVKGVLLILQRAPLDPDIDWLDFLETLAGQAAIALDNAHLFDGLQRSNMELMLAYDATIEGWSRALDLRDKETEGHTRRVTDLTLRLACAAGMSEAELVHVRRGALLHDMGKMGIPDSILLKPGPLTAEEWEIMRRHPQYALEMLSPISFLRPALDIPYCHHEKWDGTGYPRRLKGEEIPLAARLFAVVDVWDALRSDRPYRRGWPAPRVLDYITSLAGAHFDPRAVELFLQLTGETGIAPDSQFCARAS